MCPKCNIEKQIDIRYGLYKACKICVNKYHQKYYHNHRDSVIERTRQFQLNNPDKKKEYAQKHYQTHRDIILEKKRLARLKLS